MKPSEMEKNIQKPERILVIIAAGIGDLLLAVPALRALRSRFPESEIDLLVSAKCVSLLRRCPYLDGIYPLQTQGMMNRVRAADLRAVVQTVWERRRRRYDLLINLYHIFSRRGAWRMRLLCKAIGAKRTLGRNTDGRGGFYDQSVTDSWVDPLHDHRHEVEWNLDVVRLLGAEDPGQGLEFWVGDEERARVRSILEQMERPQRIGPRVVLNLGGDALYKRWPEHHFAKLGDLLLRGASRHVLLVGARQDRGVADQVIMLMKKRAVDLVGRLDLLELAALLESSDLVVTSDTGTMHLAAALAVPVIALFGPGKPGRYAPFGPEGYHVLLHYPVVCSPCTHFECRDRDCMRMITPEEVFDEAEQRLMAGQEVCP